MEYINFLVNAKEIIEIKLKKIDLNFSYNFDQKISGI